MAQDEGRGRIGWPVEGGLERETVKRTTGEVLGHARAASTAARSVAAIPAASSSEPYL